jgi:hypothetical protein
MLPVSSRLGPVWSRRVSCATRPSWPDTAHPRRVLRMSRRLAGSPFGSTLGVGHDSANRVVLHDHRRPRALHRPRIGPLATYWDALVGQDDDPRRE